MKLASRINFDVSWRRGAALLAGVTSAFALLASLALLAAIAGNVACDKDDNTATATTICTAQLAGNVTETQNPPVAACGALGTDGGADYQLSFAIKGTKIPALDVTIDVGAAPAPGTLTSEGVPSWSAIGSRTGIAFEAGFGGDAGDDQCVYRAGSDAVPAGSFTLTLDSIDTTASRAHGTLDITLRVHAPPGFDCGVGDTERVVVTF